MSSFQIVLTERKTTLFTVFPQSLKTMTKKLKTFESDKGKMVSSNFKEIFN